LKGPTGEFATGPTGAASLITGPKGTKGDTGATGTTGPQGSSFYPSSRTVVNVSPYNAANTVTYLGITVAGSVTVNLAVGVTNQTVIVKDERGTAATQNITVVPFGAQQIDNASSLSINTNYGVAVLWFNVQWHKIN